MPRRLRGVSNLIGTVILVAAALSIGMVVYHYMHTSAAAVVQKPQLMVTADASYVGNTAYIEISITNTGGVTANITDVTIDGQSVKSQLFSGTSYLLKPGQELHRVVTLNSLPSGQHIVLVTVTDAQGNTYQFKATFVS